MRGDTRGVRATGTASVAAQGGLQARWSVMGTVGALEDYTGPALGAVQNYTRTAEQQLPGYVGAVQNYTRAAQEHIVPEAEKAWQNYTDAAQRMQAKVGEDVAYARANGPSLLVGGLVAGQNLQKVWANASGDGGRGGVAAQAAGLLTIAGPGGQPAATQAPLQGKGPVTYAGYIVPDGTSDDVEADYLWSEIPVPSDAQGTGVFASMQYMFESGVGGYMGLQTWRTGAIDLLGIHVPPVGMRKAIFSVWDADPSHRVGWVGPGCSRFGGEGVGGHCQVNYRFQEGLKYTVRVHIERTNQTGSFLTGVVAEGPSGKTTKIGTLFLPSLGGRSGYGRFKSWGAAFLEYFQATGCDGQPHSSVGFAGPYFNGRTVVASQASPGYSDACPWSDVTACVPGGGCGAPHVFLAAGARQKRTTATGQLLWGT